MNLDREVQEIFDYIHKGCDLSRVSKEDIEVEKNLIKRDLISNHKYNVNK